MSEYYLSDIHFHTNLSYDAYENNNKNKFDIDSFEKIDKNNNQVKLIIKTDHNIFNYEKYCDYKEQFQKHDVVFMPGIEMNADNKIHWLFYFDDEELKENVGERTKGNIIDEIVKDVFEYSSINPNLSEISEKAHCKHEVINMIEKLNKNNISFLAVPHLDKNHGLYDAIKKEKNKEFLELVKYYLNEGIINGFESKHYDAFFSDNINSTIKHINDLEKDYINGLLDDEDEIKRRINHLNKMTSLNSSINKNGVACIYGSDYHGEIDNKYEEYQKKKEKLFFIKSQRTYEGLRLALLDQESRIYTNKKYYDLKKEDSNIIDKVVLNVNNKETTLQFGDGLNSIIGSRGSGKSYLVNLILNEGNYSESDICKQVRLKKIIMKDSSELASIEKDKCDYLKQKNSQKRNESIYEFLSDAPYNVESFGNYIKKLDNVKEEKDEEKIKKSIKIVNNQIKDEMKLVEIIKKGIDVSFFNNYQKMNEDKDDDMVVYNLFNNLVTDCKKMIDSKENTIALINSFLESTNTSNDKLLEMLDNDDFNKSLKDEDIETLKEYVNNISTIISISNSSKDIIKNNIICIKKVLFRSNNILNNIKQNLSNARLLYENNFELLSETIKNMKVLIHQIKERKGIVSDIINAPIKNIEEYSFNINNNECVMNVSTILDFNNLSEDDKKQLICNYKKDITLQEFFDCIQNYELYDNIEKIYDNQDGRYGDYSIQFNDDIKLNSVFEISTALDGQRKNLSNMSPGERSSLLLDLLLNSNNMKPLIIDQPEDDLDNETVYKVILKKIRELKTRRQIIIVTHNANLCINGDSDNIILCKNDNGSFNYISDCMESKGLYYYSSPNNLKTKLRMLDIAVEVLDGGKEALRKKMKIIGQNNLLFKEDNNE